MGLNKKKLSRKRRDERRSASRSAVSEFSVPRNWILGFILGVTFFTFANTVFNGFAYDDTTQILANLFIRDLGNLPKALVTETWYWRAQQDRDPNKEDKASTPYYRPVFVIYLIFMWKLFGASAFGWHVLNIILHLAAVYLAFIVLERVTTDIRLSAIAALLFAVHPMRTESVAWISGMTDPLLALGVLSSFYFYIRYREERRSGLMAASLGFFLLGAFTKEPAVALPIFIAVYELFIVNQEKGLADRIKPAIVYSMPFLLVSSLYFLARYFALGFALNNDGFRSYPFYQIVLTIPLVIWKYFGLLVWPVDLSLFHATQMVKSPLDIQFLLPLAAMIPLAFALWRLRRSTIARFAVLWFAINLLPVLNLSAFSEDFLVQERYVYLPSLGFSLLVAMGLAKLPIERWLRFGNRRAVQISVIAVLVVLLAGKSFAMNATWKDDMTVWFHGVEAAPEQPISHYVLAHKLINLGQYPKAAQQFEEYMKLKPDNPIVIGNLAATYVLIYQSQASVNASAADRAYLDRALALSEQGMKLTQNSAPMWDTLGQIYTFETGLKNYDHALACFQRGLIIDPNNAMISFHLGGTLVKRGNFDDGIPYLQKTIQLQSEIVDAHKFLAYAYKGKGQLREAADELTIYLKLQPNAPDYAKVSKDVQEMRAQLQTPSPQS
jgi:tetratricopeptide (TPR) repeat protein